MLPELLGPAHDGSGAGKPDPVPAIERLGNELAECRMALEHQKEIIADLLKHVGAPSQCKGCGAPILWVRHSTTTGRSAPYNPDGTNHFGSCPDSVLFRKKKQLPLPPSQPQQPLLEQADPSQTVRDLMSQRRK
jgi:hypothetical protein